MNAFVLTVLIALVAWFWASNLRAREKACEIAEKACQVTDVQFLDDTVSISRLGIGRNRASGHLSLQRVYSFEFTLEGARRYEGRVAMHGEQVKAVHLDHPGGAIVMEPGQLR